MYYHDKRLQYPVRVETPNPVFARMLQQAIGGNEGEIRVSLHYFFQAWGARGLNASIANASPYRDPGNRPIEMLETAVAINSKRVRLR